MWAHNLGSQHDMRVAYVSGSKGRLIECVVMTTWKSLINAKQPKKLMQAFFSIYFSLGKTAIFLPYYV